jgi:hypothetical protein
MQAEDAGISYIAQAPESETSKAIMAIVDRIDSSLASSR